MLALTCTDSISCAEMQIRKNIFKYSEIFCHNFDRLTFQVNLNYDVIITCYLTIYLWFLFYNFAVLNIFVMFLECGVWHLVFWIWIWIWHWWVTADKMQEKQNWFSCLICQLYLTSSCDAYKWRNYNKTDFVMLCF